MNKIDAIIAELSNSHTISEAFATVGITHISIPFTYKDMDFNVLEMPIDLRTKNALKRNHLNTIGDILRYVEHGNTLKDVRGLGRVSIKPLMNSILDFLWDCLNIEEQAAMLLANVD